MRILKTVLLGIIALAAFITGIDAIAQPCPDLPAIGTRYRCYFVDGNKVLVIQGGPVPANSTGYAELEVIAHNYNPCEAILGPYGFNSLGFSPQLGNVRTFLAPGSPVSRITGTNPGTLFPATITINLNLFAIVDALGNQTLQSAGPVTLIAGGVTSLPPTNVTVSQVAPVLFALDPNNPTEETSFTLQNTTVVLNGD